MLDVIKWAKKLYSILQDGKITKEELPQFLEALAGFIAAVVALVLPLLRANEAKVAKRLAEGVKLAAGKYLYLTKETRAIIMTIVINSTLRKNPH
jgi:hypothetical protein